MSQAAEFNWKGFFPPMKADGTDATLQITEWKGFISLTVFQANAPIIKIAINKFAHFKLAQSLTAIQKSAPNTRLVALNINEWDQAARKQSFKCGIVLGKTEDSQYYIELKDKNSSAIKFPFKWPAMITAGSDPVDEPTKSLEALAVFKSMWEHDVPAVIRLSRLNYVPIRNTGGQKGNYNNGAKSAPRPNSSSEDDDLTY